MNKKAGSVSAEEASLVADQGTMSRNDLIDIEAVYGVYKLQLYSL